MSLGASSAIFGFFGFYLSFYIINRTEIHKYEEFKTYLSFLIIVFLSTNFIYEMIYFEIVAFWRIAFWISNLKSNDMKKQRQ